MNIEQLKFKKYPVLDQGFICLVDAMGDDASIVQAARVSFGKDKEMPVAHERDTCGRCNGTD
jgi:thymidylate synthase ThyX